MKRAVVALSAFLFLVGCAPVGEPAEPSQPEARACGGAESANRSAILIFAAAHRCSAVLISERRIATAAHCVHDDEPVMQALIDGHRYYAQLVWAWGPGGEDIAILELSAPLAGSAPARLAAYSPEPQDPLVLVGYGCTGRQEARATTRRWSVSAQTTEYSGKGCSCFGDSGAPIFNSAGELVAINWAAGSPAMTDASLLR
jgi:hypothetical protein